MRTTISLDDDTRAIVESERRAGESLRQTINRLIRESQHRARPSRPLPLLAGHLRADIADVSATISELDDDR